MSVTPFLVVSGLACALFLTQQPHSRLDKLGRRVGISTHSFGRLHNHSFLFHIGPTTQMNTNKDKELLQFALGLTWIHSTFIHVLHTCICDVSITFVNLFIIKFEMNVL